MTKPKSGLQSAATKKAKKPKKAEAPPPMLTPLAGDLTCSCGCGQVADATDWDTMLPLSWNCVIQKAGAASNADKP